MVISIKIIYKKNIDYYILDVNVSIGFGTIRFSIPKHYIKSLLKLENFSLRLNDFFYILKKCEYSYIKDFILYLSKLINKTKLNYSLNKYSIKYLVKNIKVCGVILKIKFGFNDAFNTAIAFGLLSTFLINLLTIINSIAVLNIDHIELIPVFGTNVLEFDFVCIIEAKLGNIITALKLIKKNKKGSVAFGTTYPSVNENNP